VLGETLERCTACGGEFCLHAALRKLIEAHMHLPRLGAGTYSRPSPLSDPVQYRKCPECRTMMLRKNFKGSSGVVVDVCTPHGIWFDRGELGKILEFVQSGAMAIADRDAAEKEQRELERFKQQIRPGSEDWLRSEGPSGPVSDTMDVLSIIIDLITWVR
jgi:Zn-finger nucleic acid-binding protein